MAAGQDNLTAVLYGINDLRLEQRPIPEPNDDQVLLQMEVVGICGSDVHYLVEGRIGPFIVRDPMIIGHEASGTVAKCGKNVTHLKPGDRVAIEPGVPCRKCDFCKDGRYHLCQGILFCATPPVDGNLARYYVQDADFCFKLPCNMDLEEGALMEPLAVGVHATKVGNVKIGDVVLITGSGPIGLVTMMAARARGAKTIIMTDVLDIKIDMAKKLGADHAINVKGMSEDDIVNKIKQIGEEPQVSLDASGHPTSIRVASRVTKIGGVVVCVGMGNQDVPLNLTETLIKEIDFKGSFRYSNDYPTAIEMVRSGKINVKPLITHHYKLEETEKAFNTAKTQEGNPIKILIHCNPNWKPS